MDAAHETLELQLDRDGGVPCSALFGVAVELERDARKLAIETIKAKHYTRSVPSGKSHYLQFEDAIVVWSIQANNNIARFVLGWNGNVWELSRLWAPDGHEKNLLTQAISAGVELKLPGKERFVKPLSRKARKALKRATPNDKLSDPAGRQPENSMNSIIQRHTKHENNPSQNDNRSSESPKLSENF